MKKMKVAAFMMAAAMMLSSVAGCGSNSGSTGSGEAKKKDTLVVAKSEDITSLDPTLAMNQKSFTIFSQIYEGLVRYNDNTGEVEPCLATEWEQIDDTTWHFTLREGVKFHDGTDMKSDDVVFSFERLMASSGPSTYVNYIKSIEADGDYGVIIHLNEPYGQTVQALIFPCAVIVSKDAVEKEGENYAQNPVGTGAYMFVNRVAAESVTLKAFSDYWGDAAKTENLIFKVIPEASQRTVMLETGEVDIACDVSPNDGARIEDAADLSLVHKIGNKYYAIYWDTENASPIGDKKVRQALNYAIDKKAIVDNVMCGYGQVGSLLLTPNVVGYNEKLDKGNLYDPDKAKALLAEAGYANGIEFTAYVRSGQVYEEIATIIQDEFKAVGVTMKITVMESNAINEMKANGKDVPLDLGFYNNICGDQDFIMAKLLPGTYAVTYNNPYIKELLSKARSAKDDADRMAYYDEFHGIMEEDNPQVCLFYEDILVGTSKKVEGFVINPLGAHSYKTVTVAE